MFKVLLHQNLMEKVLDNIDEMDCFCELAKVSKAFYKAIGFDFRQVCMWHLIYRWKDETWCDALKDVTHRWFSSCLNAKRCHAQTHVSSGIAGRLSIACDQSVFLIDLDGLALRTRSFPFEVKHVATDNMGQVLLVNPRDARRTNIYDISTGSLISSEPFNLRSDALCFSYRAEENAIFGCAQQRLWPLRINGQVTRICGSGNEPSSRFLLFLVNQTQVYALDIQNGETFKLTEIQGNFLVYWVNHGNHVVLNMWKKKYIEIYDLGTQTLLFSTKSKTFVTCWLPLGPWLIGTEEGRFIFLDQQTGRWLWHDKVAKDLCVADEYLPWRFTPLRGAPGYIVSVTSTNRDKLPKKFGFLYLKGRNLRFIPFQMDNNFTQENHLFYLLCNQIILNGNLSRAGVNIEKYQKLLKACANLPSQQV